MIVINVKTLIIIDKRQTKIQHFISMNCYKFLKMTTDNIPLRNHIVTSCQEPCGWLMWYLEADR